jgi:hypothetical protein
MTDLSNVPIELIVPAPLSRANTIKPPQDLALILSICGDALKLYGSQHLTSTSILVVLSHIITSVNKFVKSDVDKKKIALEAIHWLIDHDKSLSDEEKNTLDLLSETVFPQAVDLFNASQSSCFSCLCNKK